MKLDKKFIARSKLRMFTGLSFVGLFTSVITYLTFAKVWAETFESYGIPIIAVYVGLPLFFLVACWFVGFAYQASGLWELEASYANQNVNPEIKKIHADITWIRKKLEE